MESNKVVIKQKMSEHGTRCNVTIDDVEINGLMFVNFTSAIDEVPRITLEFVGQDVEIELEEDFEE